MENNDTTTVKEHEFFSASIEEIIEARARIRENELETKIAKERDEFILDLIEESIEARGR